MDMSNFRHRKMRTDRLDTNWLVSIMSKQQSLSPTAQAAVKAGISAAKASAQTNAEAPFNLLDGPSFNAPIAQILIDQKGS
jgi:hypothetical protein